MLNNDTVDVRYVVAGLLIVAGLLLATGYAGPDTGAAGEQISVLLTVDTGVSTATEWVVVSNNTTAFNVLEERYNVTYTESSYGYFITGIQEVAMNDTHSWVYLVNGKPPSTAANRYMMADGDNLTFMFLSNEAAKQYFE